MLGERVRRLRRQAGLTQEQLAQRAGVSRQLVGAVEADRHLPRVDAGLALARALGVTVDALLAPERDHLVGVAEPRGRPAGAVRLGRVGERLVWAEPAPAGERWSVADALVTGDDVELLPGARPGAVVVGCDPALGLAEDLLTASGGPPLLAVPASTAAALDALAAGRTHAAVVHGSTDGLPRTETPVRRWHLASWRVGLALPPGIESGWWEAAMSGRLQVVQREQGAASQAAFERAAAGARGDPAGPAIAGPIARGHVEAAGLGLRQGLPAVSIEPAALMARMEFQPLEVHVAQLWVAEPWVDEPGIRGLGDTLVSGGFQRRLAAVGGYDLAGCGTAVAA